MTLSWGFKCRPYTPAPIISRSLLYSITAVPNLLTVITDIHTQAKIRGGLIGVMHAGLTVDSEADLVSHVSDLVKGIRQEVVCFQEVKGAERQQLKRDANVAVTVKPVQHLYTQAKKEEEERGRGERKRAMTGADMQERKAALTR